MRVIDLNGMRDNVDETWSYEAETPLNLHFRRQDHIISAEFVRR